MIYRIKYERFHFATLPVLTQVIEFPMEFEEITDENIDEFTHKAWEELDRRFSFAMQFTEPELPGGWSSWLMKHDEVSTLEIVRKS
jgi:hypothetical protein